jgi:hypothetical protein
MQSLLKKILFITSIIQIYTINNDIFEIMEFFGGDFIPIGKPSGSFEIREIEIDVRNGEVTEIKRTVDQFGNEEVEIKKGNLNKNSGFSSTRTNAGEILFSIDSTLENLLFNMFEGMIPQERLELEDEKIQKNDNELYEEKHRFDNIKEEDLELDDSQKPNAPKKEVKKIETDKKRLTAWAKLTKFIIYLFSLVIFLVTFRILIKKLSFANKDNIEENFNKDKSNSENKDDDTKSEVGFIEKDNKAE